MQNRPYLWVLKISIKEKVLKKFKFFIVFYKWVELNIYKYKNKMNINN